VTVSPLALALVAAGAAVALVGVLSHLGLPLRRRIPEPFRTQPPFKVPLHVLIGAVLAPLLIGGVLVAGALSGSHRQMLLNGSRGHAGTGSPHSSSVSQAPSRASTFDLPTWVPVAVLALVLGGIVVLIAKPSARKSADLDVSPILLPGVDAAIEASLGDLAADPDPRRAVVVAYRRMEECLAAAGLPRRAAEAPREYLSRVSAELEIDARPLATLTGLFERAKFSLRSVDPALRDEAIAALGALREELT
jgi:hypothetical protein